MCVVCSSIMTLTVAAMPLVAWHDTSRVAVADVPNRQDCTETQLYCPVATTEGLSTLLRDFPVPSISAPVVPTFAEPNLSVRKPISRSVKYQVTTRGVISADFNTFKAQVQETLDDSRGWARLGVKFEQVASGGEFTVVLSEASQVPTFASICDSTYSCQVGNYVVINQDRWQGATPSWNNAGGDLRNYRHMVVNHETGHWLGHRHANCGGPGQAAPVMQQQSINLQGCKFNAWPLDSEIWSTKLGI